jgi:23S rRNA U2552 (ribose-2'-O)-methylase RlmE/FtsJ
MDDIPPRELMILRKILYSYYNIPKRIKANYVTNAWLKTYEMLKVENIIHKTNKFTAFFNANAPGTSSMAFEHFMKNNHRDIEYDWVASSLIGDGALTDTYGIIEATRERWLMDKNNNGDVTVVKNILDFSEKIYTKYNRGVDLYFSDIGKETTDYDREEHNEIKEVYGQVVTALMTMRRGGTMITKQRNFMTPFNLSMISLLSTLFAEFKVVKPETSRQLNSEIYLIGKNFFGVTGEIKNKLFHTLNNYTDEMWETTPFDISITTTRDLYKAARSIIGIDQISSLEMMKYIHENSNKLNVLQQLSKYTKKREDSLLLKLGLQ